MNGSKAVLRRAASARHLTTPPPAPRTLWSHSPASHNISQLPLPATTFGLSQLPLPDTTFHFGQLPLTAEVFSQMPAHKAGPSKQPGNTATRSIS